MEKILAVNPGSASRRYALYDGGKELWWAHFEKDDGGFVVKVVENGKSSTIKISKSDFDNSVGFFKERIKDASVIGVRVVAPGQYFLENRKIDAGFLKKLRAAKEQAPLHVAPALLEIERVMKILPKAKMFAISDSAFYANMPANAKLYSLPRKVADKFGIYRYGYHGISIASVAGKIEKISGQMPKQVVICHLGSGSSVVAVKNGGAFDASMGFTPLEGLPMGTRIGNIDAGAVIYLAKKMFSGGESASGGKMSIDKLGEFFNHECGLLGLSGKTSDVRELLDLENKGDAGAAQALNSFVYGVQRLIGAYMATMGGLDLLVFTATIGERSFIMRRRICAGLEEMGIKLDMHKNDAAVSRDEFISAADSPVKIAVIVTDELKQIYNAVPSSYK